MLNLYISGELQAIREGSLQIEDAIDERAVASFVIIDVPGAKSYTKGQPVHIVLHDKLVFGGFIEKALRRRISPVGTLEHIIDCVDWHYLADKRVAAKVYRDMTAGDIVRDLWAEYLDDEEVYVDTDPDYYAYLQAEFGALIEDDSRIDDGPVIQEAIFNYVPVTQALDSLADRAGFWWHIDPYRRLWFVAREHKVHGRLWDGAEMREGSVTIESSAPFYRNVQYVKGGRDITDEQTESFVGDDERVAFTVGYPIARVPTITLNTTAQTVGIKGVDTARQWYWSAGDPVIVQDVGDPVLGAADTLEVTYQGEYPVVVRQPDSTEIASQQVKEGVGTGIVEDVKDEPQSTTREAAFQIASQKLEKYTQQGNKLEFVTSRSGIEPGHLLTVNLPDYGIVSQEFLVESVSARDEQARLIWHNVTAYSGPEQHTWTEFFAQVIERGSISVREGVGEETLVIPFAFTKTWLEPPDDRPNIFEELYPGAGVTPGGIYPMFDPDQRITHMAWYNGATELGRKAVTSQSGTTTLESIVFVAPFEAAGETITHFGWWGGWQATTAIGTGVEVDKQDHTDLPITKTDLEGLQITKTDMKWS